MISGISEPCQGTLFRASVPIAFPDDFLKLCGKKFADRTTFLCGYRSNFPQDFGIQTQYNFSFHSMHRKLPETFINLNSKMQWVDFVHTYGTQEETKPPRDSST
jgi:hypothetical protein